MIIIMNIETIQQQYPLVYNAGKDLYLFDYKVHSMIDDTYGINTFENIQMSHEYNTEINNIRDNNIIKDTKMNRLAQKYNKYFDIFSYHTYQLKLQVGRAKTLEIIDLIREHFKLFAFLYV